LAKSVVLSPLAQTIDRPIALGPLLDLTLRWNRGISFSFFSTDSFAGRLALLGFIVAATVFLIAWLLRCRSMLAAIGLGAIIG
jgi:lipoprotein signal peptidase